MWTHSIVSVAPTETSCIMTNNLTVSFMAFAGGIVFGVLTLFSLYLQRDDAGRDAAALSPLRHVGGAVELCCAARIAGTAAIIIAGAARAAAGHAMLFPGGYRWKESVAQGRD